MVTASANRTARIWDARTGEPIGKKLQHDDPVLTATFDASGERVVTASADKTARIWDATGSESSSVGADWQAVGHRESREQLVAKNYM